MQNTLIVPGAPPTVPYMTPEQAAAERLNQGWFLGVITKIAQQGKLYYPLNPCEVVPAGDGTIQQTPKDLMTRDPRALVQEAKIAVNQSAVKRFFGGVAPAAGTDLAVVAAQQAFGWRIRLSSDILSWNFGQLRLTLAYSGVQRVIYVAPMSERRYVDFVALAFSDNAGKGVLLGPTSVTVTLSNPASPSDSPGTIPTKTAMTIETLNVRDLGTDFIG